MHANQLKVFGWGTGIGASFASIAGGMSITSEFRHGTIRPTLLATPNRTVVVVAKVTASVLAGLLVGLLAEALTTGLVSAGLTIKGVQNTLSGAEIAQLLAGGAAAAALWAAIGTGVGAIVRSQVGAVVGPALGALVLAGYAMTAAAAGLGAIERRDIT